MTDRIPATEGIVREFAYEAYVALDNFPEFGEETRAAIVDTAGMLLYDAGYEYDRSLLEEIAEELAGTETREDWAPPGFDAQYDLWDDV